MRDEVKPKAGNRHKRDPALVCKERKAKVADAVSRIQTANPDGNLVQTNPGMRALMDMRSVKSNGS